MKYEIKVASAALVVSAGLLWALPFIHHTIAADIWYRTPFEATVFLGALVVVAIVALKSKDEP